MWRAVMLIFASKLRDVSDQALGTIVPPDRAG
jgi:hypothetical protein